MVALAFNWGSRGSGLKLYPPDGHRFINPIFFGPPRATGPTFHAFGHHKEGFRSQRRILTRPFLTRVPVSGLQQRGLQPEQAQTNRNELPK